MTERERIEALLNRKKPDRDADLAFRSTWICGYILMPGCEMPVNTPLDNLHSMKKAVEDFGRYD